MAKTITIRMNDNTYEIFKKVAESEMRTISNFIEYATLNYITQSSFVSNEEMEDILQNAWDLRKWLNDAKTLNYKLVA